MVSDKQIGTSELAVPTSSLISKKEVPQAYFFHPTFSILNNVVVPDTD